MSYLNGKILEKLVVPVHCESEQGTAFFVSNTQLLTARHVVKAHFQSHVAPAAIHISVEGRSLLCKGEELSIQGKNVDLALLTIGSDVPFCAEEYLSLLCDKFVKNMPLHVYGYPQEVAMGCNIVDFEVRNRLEIVGGVWNDRALTREDKLALHNFDGLSGAPVISMSGRVVGIIVLQINETLSYISISNVKVNLDNKGIKYDTDWENDDITTMGIGRSYQFCMEAVSTIHDRYMPELHQGNTILERTLDYISDKQHYEECYNKAIALSRCISTLPDKMKTIIQNKLKTSDDINVDMLIDNHFSFLKRCYNFLRTKPFSLFDRNKVVEINELVNSIQKEDFSRLECAEKKNYCFIGKAGSGKTHNLCEYALKNQNKANIFIFFGTDFNTSAPAISYIRDKICREMSFADFNQELKNRNRYSIIVIDAINEGLGSSYWNNHLGALRAELEKYNNIRLIISIRIPLDREFIDLSNVSWCIQEIKGFEDRNNAIDAYFKWYNIDRQNILQHLEDFKNPLFLKVFCETFHTLTEEEKRNTNKYMLYKQYVAIKNQQVTKLIDEDPERNIADKYLSKLANYSVFYAHFNPILRDKARQYGQRMAPYRLWEKDLLHACLTTNLLLEDRSQGESSVMFEYENLGDYYKADVLLNSKMDEKALLRWIDNERNYLERNTSIPSAKFRTAVKALFDCWYHKGFEVYDDRLIQNGGSLYELYYDFLMESDMPDNKLITIIQKLDNNIINPIRLIANSDKLNLDEVLKIHITLCSYPTVGFRDLIWTRYVNQIYEIYGDDFASKDFGLLVNSLDESDKVQGELILMTWMLSSSHPKFRAILIRKLKKILEIHHSLIIGLIELFKNVNDPYVLGGLYCAICGVVLSSRNKELTSAIAGSIYHSYYEQEGAVPQDIIVRQWTLKIVERAWNLDASCDYWTRIKPPFKTQWMDDSVIPNYEYIGQEFFGIQQGSIQLYTSLFGFSDFNRYVVGTNNRNNSDTFFQLTEEGTFNGIPLNTIIAELAYTITKIFGWNDKLGYLDNGKYSKERTNNETERIGKKFQWLAWYRVNARMMDKYRVTSNPYYHGKVAEEKDFTPTPYPWNTAECSTFDPTLDVNQKYEHKVDLKGIEKQAIIDSVDNNWINNDDCLPDFKYKAIDNNGAEYLMLVGYDIVKVDNEKETFLFSNACFVKNDSVAQFISWSKTQNFYGRWMPERRGMTEFLWCDYPWADTYNSIRNDSDWEKPYDCPVEMMLSYDAQLQENWEGIESKDEFMTTVYMPCREMMTQLKLYCSETRGVIKSETTDEVIAINIDDDNKINGLFIRTDQLESYLQENHYTMFYYVLGEKVYKVQSQFFMRELSAAYQYNEGGTISTIQLLHVKKRE